MSSTLKLIPEAVVAISFLSVLTTQAQPTGLAGEISPVRQKNDTLMRQYSWECRTDVLLDGVTKDLRIEQVNYGPGGQLQRTLVNDQSAPLPFGFFAARIAEREGEQVQQALVGLRGLLDQYWLPSPGRLVTFISAGTISAPDANGMLQINGGSVRGAGRHAFFVDRRENAPAATDADHDLYQGCQVTATATFITLATGLNHMAYAQVDAPATGISLQVQNFD